VHAARDADGGALREAFIPNWTSAEFEKFVDEIAELTDELYVREEGWKRVEVFKAVWEHILGIERGFWPDV
jgi:thiaminase